MVFPQLRAIWYMVPKCASTELTHFLLSGNKTLFRRAEKRDGVGEIIKPLLFLKDLGETAASRRMKREYFGFAFVCNPVKRALSGYGTISHRAPEGGKIVVAGPGEPAYYAPPFTALNRTDEPRRFEQYVTDLQQLNLSTVELRPYAGARAELPRAGLEPLGTIDPASRRTYLLTNASARLKSSGPEYRGRVPTTVSLVDNELTHAWAHARSMRSVLNMTDGDATPRKIHFVGRVESLQADLRHVMRLLGVTDDLLAPHQRAFFERGNSATWAGNSPHAKTARRHQNAQEGFREGYLGEVAALSNARTRLVAHLADQQSSRPLLDRIYQHYRADFECLNYTIADWVDSSGSGKPA